MNDLSDFQRRRAGQQGIDFKAIDWGAVRKLLRWGLVIVALIVLWNVLTRLAIFYTDWLWFRELGYEHVLIKIVVTGGLLFTAAVALFLVFALPSLYAAARATNRSPLPGSQFEMLDYFARRRNGRLSCSPSRPSRSASRTPSTAGTSRSTSSPCRLCASSMAGSSARSWPLGRSWPRSTT
jgi:hypothetical protein